MCQRVVLFLFLLSTPILAQKIPYPPIGHSYCDNHPRVMALTASQKSAGIQFIENGNYRSSQAALTAANSAGVNLTDEDLCYVYAPKWGSDKEKLLSNGAKVSYVEKGTRLGGCRIELSGDLSYKSTLPNPIRPNKMRNIRLSHIGRDWPMIDCSKLPPECDTQYTPIRLSNFIQNNTDIGLVAGDRTTVIQQWTCIKI